MADVASDQRPAHADHRPHRHARVNPFIFDKLPYDPIKDFKPISLLAKVPSLYVVHPELPAKNLKEFIALAKAKPGQMNYGSAGNGSAGQPRLRVSEDGDRHFVVHVPYRGTGPQLTDLLAVRLRPPRSARLRSCTFVKTGSCAASPPARPSESPSLPDVPTVAEQGWPGFEMTQWYGLLAPANFAPANADKLAIAAARAVHEPSALERLNSDAAIVRRGTPSEFAAFIATERERWKPVLARA